MATMRASVFESVLIFVVPVGCSEFPSKPKVGFEHEFAGLKNADSKNVCFSKHSRWFRLAENPSVETPIAGETGAIFST